MFRLNSKRAWIAHYFTFKNCSSTSGVTFIRPSDTPTTTTTHPPDNSSGRLNEYFLDLKTFTVRQDLDENKYLLQNSILRSVESPYLDAAADILNPSQISQEQFKFDKNFKMLTERLPYSSTNIEQLIYLPLVAVDAKRQTIFVDQLLIPWWLAFKPFLLRKKVRPTNLVKGTLFGMRKLDESTNGRLSKVLGSVPIMSMVDYAFDSIFTLSPKNFELLIYSLLSFVGFGGIDKNTIVDVKNKLNVLFPRYLSASLHGAVPFGHHITKHACKSIFRLQNIGIDKPNEKCVKELVRCFGKLVDEMEYSSHFAYLKDLHFMSIIFIRWSVDADRYDSIFWPSWFKKMSKYYSALPKTEGFFNALLLADLLLVALKFDKEKELIKYLPLWLDGIEKNRDFLFPENLQFLIDKVHSKYVNNEGDSFRMNEMSLTKILNVLERNY